LKSYRLAAGLWLAAIFLLTLWARPPEILPDLPSLPFADKATHALLYGVEGWLLARASRQAPGTAGRRVWRVGLFLLVVAAINESLQALVPPRAPEVGDFVADVVGGVLGAWLSAKRTVNRES
jgi:VanZ family protein